MHGHYLGTSCLGNKFHLCDMFKWADALPITYDYLYALDTPGMQMYPTAWCQSHSKITYIADKHGNMCLSNMRS
jgi:hypothetical protein